MSNKTLPKQVTILGYPYTIIYCTKKSDVDSDSEEELLGEVKFSEKEIRIFDNGKNLDVWQTLWHEIFHVFIRLFNLDAEDVEEEDNEKLKRLKAKYLERLVDLFALGMLNISFDNKKNPLIIKEKKSNKCKTS